MFPVFHAWTTLMSNHTNDTTHDTKIPNSISFHHLAAAYPDTPPTNKEVNMIVSTAPVNGMILMSIAPMTSAMYQIFFILHSCPETLGPATSHTYHSPLLQLLLIENLTLTLAGETQDALVLLQKVKH